MATVLEVVTDRAIAAGHPVSFLQQDAQQVRTFVYLPGATAGQIAAGNAFLAAIDWVAEQAALDAARAQSIADRQSLLNKAAQMLADAEAGTAACQADAADAAADAVAANAAGTLAAAKPPLVSNSQNIQRLNQRLEKVIDAVATLVKHERNQVLE